jgi:hypothetical protein
MSDYIQALSLDVQGPGTCLLLNRQIVQCPTLFFHAAFIAGESLIESRSRKFDLTPSPSLESSNLEARGRNRLSLSGPGNSSHRSGFVADLLIQGDLKNHSSLSSPKRAGCCG